MTVAKKKKPVVKSTVAILKSIEAKSKAKKARTKNPVKKEKKSYLVLKIRAPNTTNGNPRKGWIVWRSSGTFVDFVDIGYKSDNQALKDASYASPHNIVELGLIEVTGAVYSQAKKSGIYG